MALRQRLLEARDAMRRADRSDIAYVIVFSALTVLGVLPWWLSTLVPGHDYTQFLVFVRAAGDYDDPGSPFFGTYTVTPWALTPTVLPILLTRFLGWLTGSLEVAGKLLMSAYSLGLPLASAWLLQVMGRNRWCVLLVFPLLFSVWSTSGFVAFTTSSPLVLLGTVTWVRWLASPSVRTGAGFVVACGAAFLWHAIGFLALACSLGVTWLCWNAGSWRAQLKALVPLTPTAILFVLWSRFTFDSPKTDTPSLWQEPFEAMATLASWIAPVVPHQLGRAVALTCILLFGFAAGGQVVDTPSFGRWRVKSPFLWVSAAMLGAYLCLPLHMANVAGVSNRFPWFAALFFVFAWPLPTEERLRAGLLAAVGAFGLLSLVDMAARFSAFDRASVGASRLIDRLKPLQTLYGHMENGGPTPEFPNKALIGVSQYATIRFGGLPNSSFAGYGNLYVRFVNDQNPMPQLREHPSPMPAIKKFDYVLTRFGQPRLGKPHFDLVAKDGDWTLFRVCGSRAFPDCGKS